MQGFVLICILQLEKNGKSTPSFYSSLFGLAPDKAFNSRREQGFKRSHLVDEAVTEALFQPAPQKEGQLPSETPYLV